LLADPAFFCSFPGYDHAGKMKYFYLTFFGRKKKLKKICAFSRFLRKNCHRNKLFSVGRAQDLPTEDPAAVSHLYNGDGHNLHQPGQKM